MSRIISAAVCSLSWIDGRTGLPENDGEGPARRFPGYQVTCEDDVLPFRFVNLLEAKIVVEGSRIVSGSFAAASGMYRNPSFLGIPSEAFKLSQVGPDRRLDHVLFEQTVGARTVSPEVIAERAPSVPMPLIGPAIGPVSRRLAHEFFGLPPIWTRLRLRIFTDGRSEGEVVCHSLFPSMSFYQLESNAPATAGRGAAYSGAPRDCFSWFSRMRSPYDARPNLEMWTTEGWGTLGDRPAGPCRGNPWGYNRQDLSLRSSPSDTRVA